jgi:LysR family glycine cleavage system transcriptional activator
MLLNSPTLASLRFFDVAARTLSFKKAAHELHVTQGAVSQQIKHLEDALGCRLFNRLPRQITLTVEGRRFAEVVARALRDIEREAALLTQRPALSHIRLRAGPSFALRWLVPRLADFYARYPDVKLSITAAYGDVELNDRDFDLAIELAKGPIAALECEVLMEEYLIPVCTPAYLARHPFLRKPADLAGVTLLHDADAWVGGKADAEWRFWLKTAGVRGVDSTRGQFFSLANLSLEAALTHQGVAMGRVALIQELLSSGQLVTPFNRRIESPSKYVLAYPKELKDQPALLTTLRWLREQAPGAKGAD